MKLATLAYVKHNNKTLMLHKSNPNSHHHNKWNGLGGKFMAGESPEMCLVREVYEESGLIATRATLHGFITFPAFDQVDDWYTFVYTIDEFTGDLQSSDEGEVAWIDNEKVMELNLWEGDKVFLPWLEQPRFFSATFYYDKGVFQSHEVIFYGMTQPACLKSSHKLIKGLN